MAQCRFLPRTLLHLARGFPAAASESASRFECYGKVLAAFAASPGAPSVIRSRTMARSLAVVPFAFVGLFGILGTLAFTRHAATSQRSPSVVPSGPSAAPADAAPGSGSTAWPATVSVERATAQQRGAFITAPPLHFTNENTLRSEVVELYDAHGSVNEVAAARLDALLGDSRDPKSLATLTLDRRTLQLAVRAALHFNATEVRVVSAYRKPGRRREGLHASGKAIDFKLPGIAPGALAAYLRTLARVGVGIYTHPKTAYVHLDDREHSFHWLDASPPGRTWRERSIGDASLAKRDAAYARADDWPEGSIPPEGVTP